MKMLAVSEHYFPRVGGTVNYLHQTLLALIRQGIEVELWVPGPRPDEWLPTDVPMPPYSVRWLDADFPTTGDPSRIQRYRFCELVNAGAQELAQSAEAPDLLHVMFGLFVMESLDTDALRRQGVKCVATVHNVPPLECRQVPPNGPWHVKLKEEIRLRLVAWKNRKRLIANRFDAVIVPSEQVRGLLTPILKGQKIKVVGHGPTVDLQARMNPPKQRYPILGSPVNLLTVGGFAPHKRQHIIPHVAVKLKEIGLDFQWQVVGPTGRTASYYRLVAKSVIDMGMDGFVHVKPAVSLNRLAELYDAANLYVQPSTEEGFCITALDAAAAGLPIIASPAGALRQIVELNSGILVESKPCLLAKAIAGFVSENCWNDSMNIHESFSWDYAAIRLDECYKSISC